jgi:hypothetical protein
VCNARSFASAFSAQRQRIVQQPNALTRSWMPIRRLSRTSHEAVLPDCEGKCPALETPHASEVGANDTEL